MDNQHKLVQGYRDLSQSEIDAMNSIKLAEQDIGQLFQQVRKISGVDQRMLSIAKTQLQQAFSWFVRSVAQPLDVYELELPEEVTPYAQGKILELGKVSFHVGTKEIFAVPMSRAEYNLYRGWELPADEDGSDVGYLVEYRDGGKANVEGHPGYVSWSPKDVFDKAYGGGAPVKEETWVTRLRDERDTTVSNLKKLGEFLASPKSDSVPAEALEDLKLQHKAMTDLAFILSKRYDEATA